jgi:hypothetical protein
MELTTENGTTIREPSSSDLRSVLGRLGLPGNGFAILATSPQHYIQVAGSKADGYVVEYREGSEETHHSSTITDLPHQRMVDLLAAYLGGGSWKSMIQWQSGVRTKGSTTRSATGHKALVILFFVIGAISFASAAYLFYSTHQFLAQAVEVPGKVVRLVKNGGTYAPVVEYIDLQGQRRTLHSNQSSSPPAFFQGEEVKVLYDPGDSEFPLTAKISTFGQLWGTSLFAFVFGAGFGGVALAHWLVLFRRRP